MRYEEIGELAPWCALNRIFGFAPKTGLELAREFGGAAEVFRAGRKEIAGRLGIRSPYPAQVTERAVDMAAEELEMLRKRGDVFLCIEDDRYPKLLKECADAPAGLYIRSGDRPENIFSDRPAVAVVGTRDMTSYGQEWCTRIVNALGKTRHRPVIISGLAYGIDITAHIAALESGLPTVAVMATGTDRIYPFSHGSAADRIISTAESALISDYPPGTAPQAINFLRRNRIIAGLAQATILVESCKKGGGMMTCRLASSYGRDIYALPGRIGDIRSAGCNALIQEKVAEPITELDTLAESLELVPEHSGAITDIKSYVYRLYRAKINGRFAEKAAEVADIIMNNRDIRADEIISLVDMECKEFNEIMSRMEYDGIICSDILRQMRINPGLL